MRWLTSNIPVLQRLLVFILFFESGSEPYDGQHIIMPMEHIGIKGIAKEVAASYCS